MKKISLLVVCFCFLFGPSYAQYVTTLDEDFNTYCAVLGNHYPQYWTVYNQNTTTELQWQCTADGRNATPGTMCTGYYDGTGHDNDSWLFTPMLILTGYTGHLYIQFDSKFIYQAAALSIYVDKSARDSGVIVNPVFDSIYNQDQNLTPVFTNSDSSDWVTRQVDITSFINDTILVAFRYQSTSSLNTEWYIDNVKLTQFPLSVSDVKSKGAIELKVVGNSSPDNVAVQYTIPAKGEYNTLITDITGRVVYNKLITCEKGLGKAVINALHLQPGMYLLKMGNGSSSGIVQFPVY